MDHHEEASITAEITASRQSESSQFRGSHLDLNPRFSERTEFVTVIMTNLMFEQTRELYSWSDQLPQTGRE